VSSPPPAPCRARAESMARLAGSSWKGRTRLGVRWATVLTLPLVIVLGCANERAAGPSPSGTDATDARPVAWLTDVTETSGVTFDHTTGGTGALYLPEIMGGGVAVFDADGDDRLDIYLSNQNGLLPRLDASTTDHNRLFRQRVDGRFEDVTEASGLGDGGYGLGVAVGDIDNDGDRDVYVSNLGADRLYRNDGSGVFEDVTAESGIEIDGFSASAAFFDYDRDGNLDLYVAQYVIWDDGVRCTASSGQVTYCGPTAFQPTSDYLLRNEGGGRFVDVSEASGIARVSASGLGVLIEDFDLDGWPDIYVANDAYANNLWINQRDGRFVDDAFVLGAAFNNQGRPEAGMGVLAEDLDNDGLVDLFVTHLDQETNTLYRGLPDRAGFDDATSKAGLGMASWHLTGFGAGAFDLDLDGDLDLAVVNGRVTLAATARETHLPPPWDRLAEPNQIYLNQGGAVFEPGGPEVGVFSSRVEISRGLVAADLDRDGDRDLVMANIQGAPRIFRNDAPRQGDWLQVRAVDPNLGRDALGARVGIERAGHTIWRTIRRASGYLSSGPPVGYFTLPLGEPFDSLRVRWPDGLEEVFPGGSGNRALTVRRGDGEPV